MTGDVLDLLKQQYCSDLELEERSLNRYMIHTGYTYPDGDELHILLEKQDDAWCFTDDGHTMMWLSYSDFELTDTRRSLLEKTLRSNNVRIDDGVLYVSCSNRDYDRLGACLRSMIQTEIQLTDLQYLEKDVVRDTFNEDLRQQFSCSDLADRCEYDYKIIENKVEYSADIRINGSRPLLIFGIHTPLQCNRATIAMMTLRSNNQNYLFMTIFDDNVKFEKNDFNKAINESMKSVIGTSDAVNGAKMLLNLQQNAN